MAEINTALGLCSRDAQCATGLGSAFRLAQPLEEVGGFAGEGSGSTRIAAPERYLGEPPATLRDQAPRSGGRRDLLTLAK